MNFLRERARNYMRNRANRFMRDQLSPYPMLNAHQTRGWMGTHDVIGYGLVADTVEAVAKGLSGGKKVTSKSNKMPPIGTSKRKRTQSATGMSRKKRTTGKTTRKATKKPSKGKKRKDNKPRKTARAAKAKLTQFVKKVITKDRPIAICRYIDTFKLQPSLALVEVAVGIPAQNQQSVWGDSVNFGTGTGPTLCFLSPQEIMEMTAVAFNAKVPTAGTFRVGTTISGHFDGDSQIHIPYASLTTTIRNLTVQQGTLSVYLMKARNSLSTTPVGLWSSDYPKTKRIEYGNQPNMPPAANAYNQYGASPFESEGFSIDWSLIEKKDYYMKPGAKVKLLIQESDIKVSANQFDITASQYNWFQPHLTYHYLLIWKPELVISGGSGGTVANVTVRQPGTVTSINFQGLAVEREFLYKIAAPEETAVAQRENKRVLLNYRAVETATTTSTRTAYDSIRGEFYRTVVGGTTIAP